MRHLSLELEIACRQELIVAAIELMAAAELGITNDELEYYYWL